jgi:hypothetical protein
MVTPRAVFYVSIIPNSPDSTYCILQEGAAGTHVAGRVNMRAYSTGTRERIVRTV